MPLVPMPLVPMPLVPMCFLPEPKTPLHYQSQRVPLPQEALPPPVHSPLCLLPSSAPLPLVPPQNPPLPYSPPNPPLPYSPQNYSPRYHSPLQVHLLLSHSRNFPPPGYPLLNPQCQIRSPGQTVPPLPPPLQAIPPGSLPWRPHWSIRSWSPPLG